MSLTSLPLNRHLNRHFFDSPQPAGRKITAGFTYLQRIGKAASFDVWFPDALKNTLAARLAAGKTIGSEQFPAQWAAIRQFELLQESGNHKIYDLDPANLPRAIRDLSKGMRAGGYRMTVATLGTYQETSTGDELEILDQHLQARIAQMIHMLYLDMQSDDVNSKTDATLAAEAWDYREQLPHISMVLGARDLFASTRGDDQKHARAKKFFEILNLLPQNHILHDTVIGLQLPELSGENQWNYIAHPEETLASFNRVLGDLFHAPVFHLRGYGDRMTEKSDNLYRGLALALH